MVTAIATKLDIAGCTLSPNGLGLRLRKDLPYDLWEQIGEKLLDAHQAVQWWIGDWLVYGEHTYGEKYAAASSLTGYDPAYLRNLSYVADHIPETNRNPNVRFSHHRLLAKLSLGKQRKWLKHAAQNKCTLLQLRGTLELAGEIESREINTRKPRPHWWVYRVYDTIGDLLYVGHTNNLPGRLSQHGLKQPWWGDVGKIETVRFDSRQQAMAEEHKLIKLIYPRYNTIHNLSEGKF